MPKEINVMKTVVIAKSHRKLSSVVVFVLSGLLVLVLAIPVLASGAEVTRGKFHTYAAGIERGFDISGRAHMTRTADGKTIVSVHAAGLEADKTYGVHVHNKACYDANAGGHYMHDPNGGVNPLNEIWPGFTTNAAGIGNGKATNDFRARSEAQAVVIHDTDGARIACADLIPY